VHSTVVITQSYTAITKSISSIKMQQKGSFYHTVKSELKGRPMK